MHNTTYVYTLGACGVYLSLLYCLPILRIFMETQTMRKFTMYKAVKLAENDRFSKWVFRAFIAIVALAILKWLFPGLPL